MITYYKIIDGEVKTLPQQEQDCWVSVESPTEEDVTFLTDVLGIRPDYVEAAMDEKETSHIKKDDTQALIIVESPLGDHEDNAETASFYTAPIAFILQENQITTITQHPSVVLGDIASGNVDDLEEIDFTDETGFLLNVLYLLIQRYLYYLRKIEFLTLESEKNLKNATKNEELLQLLNLQKSLIFFSSALTSIRSTLDIIRRGKSLALVPENIDLLEDTLIEVDQALEQTTISSNILSTMMDAFGSVISNNVNTIMKIMTAFSIVMAVPNMVFGFYGMNVGLPLAHVVAPIVITIILMMVVAMFLYRNDFFGE